MSNMHTKKIIKSALFAALTFCATFVIKIPTLTGGYVHIGDALVLLDGWILGPVYGGLSAAIGSMLCDLIGGYPQYLLPTFIIKGLMAVIGYCLYKVLLKKKMSLLGIILSGCIAAVFMALGYYFVEAIFLGYGFGGAAVSIIPNLMQGFFGTVCATVIFAIFRKNKTLSKYIFDK